MSGCRQTDQEFVAKRQRYSPRRILNHTIQSPKATEIGAILLDHGVETSEPWSSYGRAACCCIFPNGRVDTSVIFACRCDTATHQSYSILICLEPDALAALERYAGRKACVASTAPRSWL